MGVKPSARGPLHLRAQDLARRRADRRAVLPVHVAEDERRRLEPRDPPQRRQIGVEREVAVAALPARDRVPRHRVHLHLEREQVVAALDGMAGADLVDEELAVQPLAQQAALHVGERDHDRVDSTGLDVRPQLVEARARADPTPRVASDTLTTIEADARNSADMPPTARRADGARHHLRAATTPTRTSEPCTGSATRRSSSARWVASRTSRSASRSSRSWRAA